MYKLIKSLYTLFTKKNIPIIFVDDTALKLHYGDLGTNVYDIYFTCEDNESILYEHFDEIGIDNIVDSKPLKEDDHNLIRILYKNEIINLHIYPKTVINLYCDYCYLNDITVMSLPKIFYRYECKVAYDNLSYDVDRYLSAFISLYDMDYHIDDIVTSLMTTLYLRELDISDVSSKKLEYINSILRDKYSTDIPKWFQRSDEEYMQYYNTKDKKM